MQVCTVFDMEYKKVYAVYNIFVSWRLALEIDSLIYSFFFSIR
jgi:hypothetical protein